MKEYKKKQTIVLARQCLGKPPVSRASAAKEKRAVVLLASDGVNLVPVLVLRRRLSPLRLPLHILRSHRVHRCGALVSVGWTLRVRRLHQLERNLIELGNLRSFRPGHDALLSRVVPSLPPVPRSLVGFVGVGSFAFEFYQGDG